MEITRKEWNCEQFFLERGPFFHIYSQPLGSDLFYQDDEDRIVTMNRIALEGIQLPIRIWAFTLMSNHFHFIIEGEKGPALLFFQKLKDALSRYYGRKGRHLLMRSVISDTTPITSLKQLRDEVVYVLRNPYVVRNDVNPLNYRWSSGFLYFNDYLSFFSRTPMKELSARMKREITKSRDYHLPDHYFLLGEYISPASYIDPTWVERLFTGARQFTLWLFKNVEAQVEVSRRYGEEPNFSDEELLRTMLQLCRRRFGVPGPRDLTLQQKKELAILLKNTYCASNGQLQRLTTLNIQEISALFPLAQPDPK